MNVNKKTKWSKLGLTLFILVSINTQIFSQCKLNKLNDNVVITKDIAIADVMPFSGTAWDLNIVFMKNNNSSGVVFVHECQAAHAYRIKKFEFKFSDGSVLIKDNPLQNTEGEKKIDANYTSLKTFFQIDLQELKKISELNIVSFKIDFEKFPEYPASYEKELKSKVSDKLKSSALCLYSEFNKN